MSERGYLSISLDQFEFMQKRIRELEGELATLRPIVENLGSASAEIAKLKHRNSSLLAEVVANQSRCIDEISLRLEAEQKLAAEIAQSDTGDDSLYNVRRLRAQIHKLESELAAERVKSDHFERALAVLQRVHDELIEGVRAAKTIDPVPKTPGDYIVEIERSDGHRIDAKVETWSVTPERTWVQMDGKRELYGTERFASKYKPRNWRKVG